MWAPRQSQSREKQVAPPFQAAEFDILFNEGISRIGSIIDLGVDMAIIDKKGTWFSYNTTRLGQGREAAREELKKNPKLVEEIEKAILARIAEGKVLPLKETPTIGELAEV